MAPLSSGSAYNLPVKYFDDRAVAGNETMAAPRIDPAEQQILQIIAMTFASISVASSTLAFYWFVRMRRSFRHDLIMLLIQGDMFKALWFMVYPLVVFVNGPVASKSPFCQASGFFLAVGIEQSDVAVLMIAIHSGLYIFGPISSAGEGGLYPHRHIAYSIWFIFPVLMASFAFINGRRDAYVSDGTYCYLPVRPAWYRLALAWIPRYLIFIIILGIYASIYCYVRYKFEGFSRHERNRPSLTKIPRKQDAPPPLPHLNHHGLLPLSRPSSPKEIDSDKIKRLEYLMRSNLDSHAGERRETSSGLTSASSTCDEDSFREPSSPRPLPRVFEPVFPHRNHISEECRSSTEFRTTSWRDRFVRRVAFTGCKSLKRSDVDIYSALRRHPDSMGIEAPISQLEVFNSRSQPFVDAELFATRDKIRRQLLRYLFIYPMVYIGMWILPFISQTLQYDNSYAMSPPFALTCVATVSMSIQAAVDCWVFSTREKPWRHIPGCDGSFFDSLRFWNGWQASGDRSVGPHGPGKTREEMVREARAAYQRRDKELAHRRHLVETPDQKTEPSRRLQRCWWDAEGSRDLGRIVILPDKAPILADEYPSDLEPDWREIESMASNYEDSPRSSESAV